MYGKCHRWKVIEPHAPASALLEQSFIFGTSQDDATTRGGAPLADRTLASQGPCTAPASAMQGNAKSGATAPGCHRRTRDYAPLLVSTCCAARPPKAPDPSKSPPHIPTRAPPAPPSLRQSAQQQTYSLTRSL
eukprot:6212244-Pleurochrysis_carterae.AAC.6